MSGGEDTFAWTIQAQMSWRSWDDPKTRSIPDLTQEDHNILYVAYYLLALDHWLAVDQLKTIDGATNVSRVVSTEQYVDELCKLNKIYGFATMGGIDPKRWTGDRHIFNGGKNEILFQHISSASAKHKEQREHIDRAVEENGLKRYQHRR
ncbi:hypothetical protein IQ06DRAFT_372221 [Phaeosphaeriaceae sp. SRC1lsM3a]|nr:hypothetical protein IQ06DRAFT_372221 [Stagonospora sp. SRC1lsM3a]